MAAPQHTPRVRAVVVNYNGGDHIVRCVEHLTRTEWPDGALEVVVVDNASTDGSDDVIEKRFPDTEVIRAPVNLGFAGGNNIALRDLGDTDYVALVNVDAFVEPGWLRPLVERLSSDKGLGAVNPRILLEPRFVAMTLRAEGFTPGHGDTRTLAVRATGVDVDGSDRWGSTLFRSGFSDEEADPAHPHFRWAGTDATIWLPVSRTHDGPWSVRLRCDAERVKSVKLSWPEGDTTAHVGPEATWIEVRIGAPTFDVINSTGNVLVDGAYGADRGYGEADSSDFDRADEVFAWTGAVVLLDRGYLDDVGLFDDDFFLYSEDFDLSWRGRLRGWRYGYEPRSRAFHVRGAITGHRSALADHYSHRNALLTLVKNAPASTVRREVGHYLRDLWRHCWAEVVQPLLRRRRPQAIATRRRFEVVLAFIRRLPSAIVKRRSIGRRARVSRDAAAVSTMPPAPPPA